MRVCGLQDAEGKWKDFAVITTVFVLLLGAMTSVFFFNCVRKLVQDQKIIRVRILSEV